MILSVNLEKDIVGIENGDLVLGFAFDHQFTLIMESAPGHFIEDPLEGVDVRSALNSPGNAGDLERRARERLEANGWNVRTVRLLANGELDVDAYPPLIN